LVKADLALFVCDAAKLTGPFLDSAPKRSFEEKGAVIEAVIQIFEDQATEMVLKEHSSSRDGIGAGKKVVADALTFPLVKKNSHLRRLLMFYFLKFRSMTHNTLVSRC
tara:strand:- start:347 stop:670 length:324 start_codon:yes stop_codon:yes gene_type:complete